MMRFFSVLTDSSCTFGWSIWLNSYWYSPTVPVITRVTSLAADIAVLYFTFQATWGIFRASSEMITQVTLVSLLLRNGKFVVWTSRSYYSYSSFLNRCYAIYVRLGLLLLFSRFSWMYSILSIFNIITIVLDVLSIAATLGVRVFNTFVQVIWWIYNCVEHHQHRFELRVFSDYVRNFHWKRDYCFHSQLLLTG